MLTWTGILTGKSKGKRKIWWKYSHPSPLPPENILELFYSTNWAKLYCIKKCVSIIVKKCLERLDVCKYVYTGMLIKFWKPLNVFPRPVSALISWSRALDHDTIVIWKDNFPLEYYISTGLSRGLCPLLFISNIVVSYVSLLPTSAC